MRTPYLLGIRGIIRFESAVQGADTDVLQSMLKKLSANDATPLDQRKLMLVEAELTRRKAGEAAAWISVVLSLLEFLSVIL